MQAATSTLLKSSLCTEAMLMRPDLQAWPPRFKDTPGFLHRKLWEWCFISQAFQERGMLAPGRRGLGFAVGQEPLAAVFATFGAQIVATDLFAEAAAEQGWVGSSQHAQGYAAINSRGLCDEEVLRRQVEFQFADMNDIRPELHAGFDFLWSSCAFEHLGSLEHGAQFVLNAMECLRPGGVAVHTTEFNVSSNEATLETGGTVLYRRRDIEDLVKRLRQAGHEIDIELDVGNSVADNTVDVPPYTHNPHLKLQIEQYVTTSIGLIVVRGAQSSRVTLKSAAPRRPWWRLFGNPAA